MLQFKPCKFTETDRSAKGRKRDNIPNGFAGIQCRHCAGRTDGRKFFWSNVDRLANSFTEIPVHLMKCRKCPPAVRDTVVSLKKSHLEQMARLPRGSQKVFFRRMWRRLHEDLKKKAASSAANDNENDKTASGGANGDGVSSISANTTTTTTSDGNTRVLLSVPEDRDWLSDLDCFVRRNLEVFLATEEDVKKLHDEKKYRVVAGQVGMRCVHCAATKEGARGSAIFFPYMTCDIFEFVRDFQKNHLDCSPSGNSSIGGNRAGGGNSCCAVCPNMPSEVKEELAGLTRTVSSLNSMLKRYSVLAAKALGLYDTSEGIRAKNDSILQGVRVPLDMLANIAATR